MTRGRAFLRSPLRAVVALLAAALVLSGCSFDVYKLPLPGGTDVGSDPITITAQFRDVLDLVPQSTVKVNDVTVGKITDVKLQGYHALVTMQLRNDTRLPDNAVATIQQTSLLGEKFVELAAPPSGASPNPLKTGDIIPIDHTGQNPEVEEVLGALSLLLNGGGVGQLQTITRELNKTLHGREGEARSVLHQIKLFSGQLDRHKQDIVEALDALDRLSTSLNRQRDTIDATLGELPGALRSIDTQRHDLVRMLKALAHLSGVGTRVITLSKDSTIATLRQLSPVLSQLKASGSDFVNAFQVALTYPFVDDVVGRDPQVARNLQMGDYTDLSIKLDLALDQDGSLPIPTGLPTALPTGLPTGLPTDLPTSEITKILGDVARCLRSGDLTGKACQKVLADPQELLRLIAKCRKHKNDDNPVCQALNALPTLPTLGTGLPSLSIPTGLLPSLLGGEGPLGAQRVAFGPRGPTMRQLSRMYDPALVDLLVPGMVIRR
jgi:phospholipid/cholesterol/gamma-HCH transport system substrate-binding protein